MSINKLVLQLWSYISIKRRWQLLAYTLLVTLCAFAEAINIGLVLPFLTALTSHEGLQKNPRLATLASFLNIDNQYELLYLLTITFILSAILAAGMRLLLLLANIRISFGIGADFSNQIYRKTLYQPYEIHINRNSSDVISGVMAKTNHVISNVVLPLLTIASSFFMMVTILVLVTYLDPVVSIVMYAGFMLIYLIIILGTKKRLVRDSIEFSNQSSRMVKVLQEALGGIRDILLDNSQEKFCEIYKKTDSKFRRAQYSSQFIGQSPRYIFEALGIILIASTTYILIKDRKDLSVVLPMLGVLALSAQRILPMLQQIFSSWTCVRAGQGPLQDILLLLNQPMTESIKGSFSSIHFKETINLENISFKYSGSDLMALEGINLSIRKNQSIGIIGETGSGKSTLVDLIMGLLEPTSGKMVVDETQITTNNQASWRANIAHVPQNIYLFDATIEENISFGGDNLLIDEHRVRLVAKVAQADNFISNLDAGYKTNIGENGVRLSGGERQRIGLARALYRDPKILVLDEATSALDAVTEKNVIDSIHRFLPNVTLIMIAHRVSTLKNCNKIIVIKNNKIFKETTYSQLMNAN